MHMPFLQQDAEGVTIALGRAAGFPCYVAGEEIAGDAFRDFGDALLLMPPLACATENLGFLAASPWKASFSRLMHHAF